MSAKLGDGKGINGNNPLYEVITVISDRKGVDPMEMPPMYHEVDPEVVELLSNNESLRCTIEFSYQGYQITVRSDGQISVQDE